MEVGAMGALGAALPAAVRVPRRSDRRLIVVWLDGGASHLDTWDAKPEAPVGIRGDVGSIRGAIEGTFVADALPGMARRLDRCALIRSVTHGEGNHDRGAHFVLTGQRPSPVLAYPGFGACAAELRDAREPELPLPAYVAIPDAHPHAGAGYLAADRGPFATGGDPGRPGFAVPHLVPPGDRGRVRGWVDELDRLDAQREASGAAGSAQDAAQRVRDTALAMTRPELRRLFDLERLPAALRERFGRHRLGQSCLLALELVAAGVRTAFVRDRGWDHHRGIARSLTFGYPPPLRALDEALSALLDELRARGLDQHVTVLVASEFGRTPRLNPSGGRDHWPRAQSVLLAGAGVRAGVVHGATDARGEEPASDPVSPADLWATVVACQQLDPAASLTSQNGRPVRLCPPGSRAVREVLA